MNRLTILFIFTTVLAIATSLLLALGIVHQAGWYSEYSQERYYSGLHDGETLTKAAFARALAERELMEESEAHIAEERL